MAKAKEEAIATFTIKDVGKMSPALRHELAKWLRRQGAIIENHPNELASNYRARYYLS